MAGNGWDLVSNTLPVHEEDRRLRGIGEFSPRVRDLREQGASSEEAPRVSFSDLNQTSAVTALLPTTADDVVGARRGF